MLFIQNNLAILAITLGLGQLAVAYWGLWGLSLIGPRRRLGYGLGGLLLVSGAVLLPATWGVLWWMLPMGLLAVVLMIVGGSFITPIAHPDRLFSPTHPAHTGCQEVRIRDEGHLPIPGILLRPVAPAPNNPAICIVPGAGDTKTNFKWRLVETLLGQGFVVLSIDPPGHGQYRQRPLAYPDCLSVVPAAIDFLSAQPGIGSIGLIGISLGGALALRSLAAWPADRDVKEKVSGMVIMATPTHLAYSQGLLYRELWRTLTGAPIISLFKEITVRQVRQSWYTGGYQSRHTTSELFALLNPLKSIRQLGDLPILLVYSQRDGVSPPKMAQAMQQAAPQATLINAKKASHVTLILTPSINQQIGDWLRQTFF